MKTVSFDTKTMSPWSDIHRLLSNAKTLKVAAGGKIYEGKATLEDADGHLTLVFERTLAKSKFAPTKKVERGAKK